MSQLTFTGFKAMKAIKFSQSEICNQDEFMDILQGIIDDISSKADHPSIWSMVRYDPAGKHEKRSVQAITGIVLEYQERYAADLGAGLSQIPFRYAVARTERSTGRFFSVFFPLAFQPDTNQSIRIAGVLAHQIGCYGLGHGSGTPTFLVRLEGSQTAAYHDGPVISQQFIHDTAKVEEACTALEDYEGPKPATDETRATLSLPTKRLETDKFKVKVTESTENQSQSKNRKIAAQMRVLADLFEADD